MGRKSRTRCPKGWEEVTEVPEIEWELRADGLCFYADANVPRPIVEEIRANKIPVIYAQEEGAGRALDGDIAARAHDLGCVVLTFDRDFWQEGKHPLSPHGGFVFVSVPNDRPEDAIDALAAFYWEFAQYWPVEWWKKQKARVYTGGFMLRFVNYRGAFCESDHQFVGDRWCSHTTCT